MEDGTLSEKTLESHLQAHINAQLKTLDFEPSRLQPTQSRSSTIDSLFRQNEDISARLKVAVQRLAQLEDQIDHLEEKNKKIMAANDGLKDQLLIWKEKERIWMERIVKAEHAAIELKDAYPKITAMQLEIDRYHKYHEKVKTQIKPYIQQLKEYAKGLAGQVKGLNQELAQQERGKSDLASKATSLESEIALQKKTHDSLMEEVKTSNEAEVLRLKSEITFLNETNIELENKAQHLNSSLSKQDELENEVIVLRRKLGEYRDKITTETEGLRVSLQIARNEILQKNLIIDDYKTSTGGLKNQVEMQAQEINNISDQLLSLRFMWTEKCAENEQIKSALSSLEKLNLELSQKMRDLRE